MIAVSAPLHNSLIVRCGVVWCGVGLIGVLVRWCRFDRGVDRMCRIKGWLIAYIDRVLMGVLVGGVEWGC